MFQGGDISERSEDLANVLSFALQNGDIATSKRYMISGQPQMKALIHAPVAALGLLLAVLVVGCTESNPTNSFEPAVTNTTDSFSLRASNAYLVTSTLRYTWTNTGEQATIYHSTSRTAGAATLVIVDANSTQVYSGDLRATGSEVTLVGAAGDWGIVVVLEGFSGNCGFNAQKL